VHVDAVHDRIVDRLHDAEEAVGGRVEALGRVERAVHWRVGHRAVREADLPLRLLDCRRPVRATEVAVFAELGPILDDDRRDERHICTLWAVEELESGLGLDCAFLRV